MKVRFKSRHEVGVPIVIGAFSDGSLTSSEEFHLFKSVKRAVESFSVPFGKACFLDVRDGNGAKVIIVGLGARQEVLSRRDASEIGARMCVVCEDMGMFNISIAADAKFIGESANSIAFGYLLRSHKFDKYKIKKSDGKSCEWSCRLLDIVTLSPVEDEKDFFKFEKIADAVRWARAMCNEPANVLYPESFAAEISDKLVPLGVDVEVMGEKMLVDMGFGGIIGVGQGSERPPRFVVMKWNGAKDKKEAPVAFVGKGVTFDSGGISIKPSRNMDHMKADMSGAAIVAALMGFLAAAKISINAVGAVALAENMVSGRAQRPGDIIRSLSGKTIEVLNTDAEGRIILADALYYVQGLNPKHIIDIATLTGAARIAVGKSMAALISNDDELAGVLDKSGKIVGERVCRLPIVDEYEKELDSHIADVKNITSDGVGAGTITAAMFLRRFIPDCSSWAHIDIASVDFADSSNILCERGATAFGLQLLCEAVEKMANV
ncbi:leucyl aminopeptidase [Candidatus Hydrogenosomobacter endosymbioticus]|uniref:Probable cytosol aminopeptidase n=1 Tax=Candidatus Hydrogenosomobacter endosymbioticus TaxID=2558174 RepID=A0ABM7VAA0_9PROT|nr:leucyl aminopeptidase [Candidatus Hydrogenosomobacter endosymbioticus]BDB96460.1 putative cytosol aminopeptidase [Candidatus Hydrogenosomobacter endosymbioticus]